VIRLVLAAVLALLAGRAFAADCTASAVGYRVMQIAGRNVALWYPTAAAPSQYAYSPRFSSALAFDAPPSPLCGSRVPLVVFSHGYTGCGLQSVAFTEELARHGYVVAAPDHRDALFCHIATGPAERMQPEPSVFRPQAWTEASFADRRADIAAVIDALLQSPLFGPVIDPQKIGAAGHSLGGYTVVGMAGGWPNWTDRRIRAVLAMSPYVMPFQVQHTLGGVKVPLMYQGGTLDIGITPFLTGARGAYANANPPAYLVVLKGAAHFAWVNCGSAHTTADCLETRPTMRLIDDYGIAFFDHYLKDQPAPLLTRKDAALADYQFRLSP
jgi:predicted dienelactone hydrolase